MLGSIFKFETRYWLRGMMVWVFLLVIAALIWGATSSDKVTVGGSVGNIKRNAPFVVEQFYAVMSIMTLLMTVAFVNSAAARDFSHNTAQLIFSRPIGKASFLMGRFLGAFLISNIPLLGVTLGVLAAPLAPWADIDRFGPTFASAHWNSILTFAIPNTFLVAAVIFCIAALTRSTITSFLGGLFLLMGYLISDYLLTDFRNEDIAALLDPFGIRTFSIATKYWTVAERNSRTLGWEGLMFWNRLLWMAVGVVALLVTIRLFRFEERSSKAKKTVEPIDSPAMISAPIMTGRAPQNVSRWRQFLGVVRTEFFTMVRSTSFIVICAGATLNVIPSLIFDGKSLYGNPSLPVTYNLLLLIAGALYIFLIAILTYYSGVMVWRERDARMDEIHDALPYPQWISYAGKFVTLMGVIAIIDLIAIACGIGLQLFNGYTRLQLGLYFSEVFFFDFTTWILLGILAFLIHILASNKYAGYFGFIILLITNAFIWRPLNVVTNLAKYGSRPGYSYSDLFQRDPFLPAWGWFTTYWMLIATILVIAGVALWPRGKETSLTSRLREARAVLRGSALLTLVAFIGLATATGSWIIYNTHKLNRVTGEKEALTIRSDYEKTYKKFKDLPQPRIVSVKYNIDLDPSTRNMTMQAEQVIRNKHSQPVDQIHFSVDRDYDMAIEIPRAQLQQDDKRLTYRQYRLDPPMQPGEERTMRFTVKSKTRGFENEISNSQLVQNGTFFNNYIAPQIGYQPGAEISDKNDRKEYGLPEKDPMPALERNCTVNCGSTYLSNNSDWVDVETIISTDEDQIAIAPGSLQRDWKDKGRRYFQYKLDTPSLNFYSFLSARYEVAREKWNDVNLEVYYHKDHASNVPKMLSSMRKSLDYFSKNFGPYRHKQARIIEFPRTASFAQAFPGTMPYSESIGFIADLEKPDAIDFVFYVVAHEMAHQWWAHQVVGANMQGATLLSESMAQYSALIVMEKEYGPDQIGKFLEFEADRYLRGRGGELRKEKPLLTVESNQGYIHYQKASVVMYALKEMIGEQAINRALRNMIDRWSYKGPPYPTSHDLLDLLRAETPAELQYLIKDSFEEITLFANRTLTAKANKRNDGKFDVTIEVETSKLKADDAGNEQTVPMNDVVEIGAYAAPEKGKKYGKLLYSEKFRVENGKRTFSFITAERPDKAGVDPRRLLVDRVPSDNMKSVTGG